MHVLRPSISEKVAPSMCSHSIDDEAIQERVSRLFEIPCKRALQYAFNFGEANYTASSEDDVPHANVIQFEFCPPSRYSIETFEIVPRLKLVNLFVIIHTEREQGQCCGEVYTSQEDTPGIILKNTTIDERASSFDVWGIKYMLHKRRHCNVCWSKLWTAFNLSSRFCMKGPGPS